MMEPKGSLTELKAYVPPQQSNTYEDHENGMAHRIKCEDCQTGISDCFPDQAGLVTEQSNQPQVYMDMADQETSQYTRTDQSVLQNQDVGNDYRSCQVEMQQSMHQQNETQSHPGHYESIHKNNEHDSQSHTDQYEVLRNEQTGEEFPAASGSSRQCESFQPSVEGQVNNQETESECSQLDQEEEEDEEEACHLSSQYEEAEEIVKKLCKNGKLMQLQFQEEDGVIKVTVTEDLEETLSAEEETENGMEGGAVDGENGEQHGHNNSLECLLANEKENVPTSPDCTGDSGPRPCKRPRPSFSTQGQVLEVISDPNSQVMQHNTQWYPGMLTPTAVPSSSVTPASAIQTNFAHTVNQFAPSFLTCNMADLDPTQVGQPQPQSQGPKDKVRGSQLYTPQSRNGFMYYVPEEVSSAEGLPTSAPLATSSPAPRTQPPRPGPRCSKQGPSMVQLNSSGEENVSPRDPSQEGSSRGSGTALRHQQLPKKVRSLIQLPEDQIEDLGKIREQHNQKERKRRARIKEACNLLRQLVPGMSDKTDKATVFEFAARYVFFLKSHTGPQYDKDFLMKYSPY